MSWTPYTRYQKRKARAIAAVWLQTSYATNTPLGDLPELAAHMSEEQWRTVSFAAGQANAADEATRNYVVAILLTLAQRNARILEMPRATALQPAPQPLLLA